MKNPKYIAAGFEEDAARLIEAFIKENTFEFPAFAKKWKEFSFVCIYMGREPTELCQFTNEIFQLTLGYLDNPSFLYQVSGIYLLYCLFLNQLVEPKVKIRITLRQLNILTDITATAIKERKKFLTLLYVMDYLKSHAYELVAHAKLCGPCIPMQREENCPYRKTDFIHLSSKKETIAFANVLQDVQKDLHEYEGMVEGLTECNMIQSKGDPSTSSAVLQKCLDDLHVLVSGKGKMTRQDKKSDIGSRRTALKKTQFESRTFFRQLNPDEPDVPDKPTEHKRIVHKKRQPKKDRKPGRPRKDSISDQALLDKLVSDNETQELIAVSPKMKRKRGPIERNTYLEDDDLLPSTGISTEIASAYFDDSDSSSNDDSSTKEELYF